MRYTLNTYHGCMALSGMRVEVYPNRDTAAKLVADYEECGYVVKPFYQLIPNTTKSIPTPKQAVDLLSSFVCSNKGNTVFTGLDSYLAFLTDSESRDFFIGLRRLVDTVEANARFLVGDRFVNRGIFSNPRYEEGLQIVFFEGEPDDDTQLGITLINKEWACGKATSEMTPAALKALGDYSPVGSFVFSVEETFLPNADRGYATVLREPMETLRSLFGVSAVFSDECAVSLLKECDNCSQKPMDMLADRFGVDNINVERAPLRLQALQGDPLWDCYVWMLKAKAKPDSYLIRVLEHTKSISEFMKNYVVDTAMALIGKEMAPVYAAERAAVLSRSADYEPMIAGFVSETENDDRAICFLNCGTDTELKALIRHAQRLEHTYGLPEVYDKIVPVLNQYLSPYYDYGCENLTTYFHKLRCFRMSNSINDEFVKCAYEAQIPKAIRKRDEVIPTCDDGETALLIVDGMGAEYYPLLLNMAKQNDMKIESSQIVSVKLPSSTEYNAIKWPAERILQGVHRVDNISHEGYSAYEKCSYEENLAAIFTTFRKDILPRIKSGLGCYKRVIVTADHGASYLAVNAHKDNLDKTLPWDYGTVDDWRYAILNKEITTPDGMVSYYSPDRQQWFYVVKGYNRLSKPGNKPYALHGGATLEEMLVPFVIFTNDTTADKGNEHIDEFIEDDAFDAI